MKWLLNQGLGTTIIKRLGITDTTEILGRTVKKERVLAAS